MLLKIIHSRKLVKSFENFTISFITNVFNITKVGNRYVAGILLLLYYC